MKWTLAGAGTIVFVASLAACSGDEGAPGPGGTGTSSSGTGGAADGGGGNDGGGGGLLATGAVGCNVDGECASGHCFLGNMQHFCTLVCTTDNATTVCESPLTGTCNKQGYCKRD